MEAGLVDEFGIDTLTELVTYDKMDFHTDCFSLNLTTLQLDN